MAPKRRGAAARAKAAMRVAPAMRRAPKTAPPAMRAAPRPPMRALPPTRRAPPPPRGEHLRAALRLMSLTKEEVSKGLPDPPMGAAAEADVHAEAMRRASRGAGTTR